MNKILANFLSVGFLAAVYTPEIINNKGVAIALQSGWISAVFVLLIFPIAR